MNWKKTLLICIVILLVAAGVTAFIFSTEPEAQRQGATKETAMLVEVTEVKKGTFRPTIVATGTVQAARDILLSPRVNGEVLSLSSAFTPGGYVQKGQTLLQIDPADFRNMVELRKSDLQQAEADLSIEMGRQDIARQDYELVGETLSVDNKALVLREPQLNAVKARIKAAKASVDQAQLNLKRTTIKAPFNAHILSQNVNVGSQVSLGDNLGRLVGVEEYWVMVNVPVSKLRLLRFPKRGATKGAGAKIRNRTAWGEDQFRIGHLYKFIGALESQTRLARVLVSVSDPLAQGRQNAGKPPLIIGEFVEVRIQGEEVAEVVRVSRDYIRKEETIWVMEAGELKIRKLTIDFMDAEYAYVTDGLEEGNKVVTTNLTTVVDGAKLRTEGESLSQDKDSMQSPQSVR